MDQKWLFILLVCFLSSRAIFAQDLTYVGLVPNIQFDGKLSGKLDYFFQTGSEIFLMEHRNGETINRTETLTLDLTGGVNFDAGTDWNVAFSFLARSRSPFDGASGTELRPMQQVTHIARFGKYRIRNRFRAEQRFIKRNAAEEYEFDLRLRYRLSLDFPLNGDRLDNREFYLNTSVEWLVTPTRERFIFYSNPRGYTGLGYQFNKKHRLEAGPEFRTRNTAEDGRDEHILYVRATWIKSL